MRIYIHGTDKGNAMLVALIIVIVFSTLFITITPRIFAIKAYAHEYKTQIIRTIEQSNREIMNHYDIY